MNNALQAPNGSFTNERREERNSSLQFIIKQVEKGTGLTFSELKKQYSEDHLFSLALKHVTTTKKALCTAFNIPVEAGCRYKRSLEKDGCLVQSIDEVICPLTKHPARLITTNSQEFERLLKSNTHQLNLFE